MDGLTFLFSCSFLLNENSQFFSRLSLRSTRLTSVKFAAYYLKGIASYSKVILKKFEDVFLNSLKSLRGWNHLP